MGRWQRHLRLHRHRHVLERILEHTHRHARLDALPRTHLPSHPLPHHRRPLRSHHRPLALRPHHPGSINCSPPSARFRHPWSAAPGSPVRQVSSSLVVYAATQSRPRPVRPVRPVCPVRPARPVRPGWSSPSRLVQSVQSVQAVQAVQSVQGAIFFRGEG